MEGHGVLSPQIYTSITFGVIALTALPHKTRGHQLTPEHQLTRGHKLTPVFLVQLLITITITT